MGPLEGNLLGMAADDATDPGVQLQHDAEHHEEGDVRTTRWF